MRNFKTVGSLILLAMPTAALLRAQTDPAALKTPSFEVASIKLNNSPVRKEGFQLADGTFNATNTLMNLVRIAYGHDQVPLNAKQVSGGPDWIKSEFFEIHARVDDALVRGAWRHLSNDQRMNEALLMLRSLLADRFRLKTRQETKDVPVYALVLAKNGPLFPKDEAHIDTGGSQMLQGHYQMQSGTLDSFAVTLSDLPDLDDRPVLNKTGLDGHYTLAFDFSPYMIGVSVRSADPSSGPSLFTALQERLGLKLQSTKAPVQTIVIENVEQPSPN